MGKEKLLTNITNSFQLQYGDYGYLNAPIFSLDCFRGWSPQAQPHELTQYCAKWPQSATCDCCRLNLARSHYDSTLLTPGPKSDQICQSSQSHACMYQAAFHIDHMSYINDSWQDAELLLCKNIYSNCCVCAFPWMHISMILVVCMYSIWCTVYGINFILMSKPKVMDKGNKKSTTLQLSAIKAELCCKGVQYYSF